jgi:hypothetical protein
MGHKSDGLYQALGLNVGWDIHHSDTPVWVALLMMELMDCRVAETL